jgi:hypothetical protein
MDLTIKLALIAILFMFGWLYQEQNQEWDVQRNLLKQANNFAAHDAALQVDEDQKSAGRLVIDPAQARAVYEETLRRNLALDESLSPKLASPLLSDVRIVYFEIVDETNSTFPMLYEKPEFGLAQWVYGPSVVSVIETDHPQLVRRIFQQEPIRVPTIQEHKENEYKKNGTQLIRKNPIWQRF